MPCHITLPDLLTLDSLRCNAVLRTFPRTVTLHYLDDTFTICVNRVQSPEYDRRFRGPQGGMAKRIYSIACAPKMTLSLPLLGRSVVAGAQTVKQMTLHHFDCSLAELHARATAYVSSNYGTFCRGGSNI